MSRLGAFGIVGCLVALAGCSSGDGGAEALGESTAQSLSVVGPKCPTTRAIWVAPSSLASVATVAGNGGSWRPSRVFRSSVPGLAAYWSFTWTPSAALLPVLLPADSDFDALGVYVASVGSTPAQRDCDAVTALATTTPTPTDGVWSTMRAKNAERTSKLATLPSAAFKPVRVAVVDSAAIPYAGTSMDTFGHGRSVGRSIRELSCPSDGASTGISNLASYGGSVPINFTPPCVGQVANFPALIHLSPTATDTTNGGYFGTEGELASAIAVAVDSWLAEPIATKPPHLVVNLSVGWDNGQGYGGEYVDKPEELPPAARAVQAAITHAVCRGGLVVAAAGNMATPSSTGPMFPAAWEAHAAPSATQCAAFEGAATLPADPATVTYRPLVHAVAGLDAVDAPLSSTRILGRPRMAAYGENVVTSDPRATHTDNLTGTSMAAANVTAIAAAAWGYKSTATANEIMQLVYDHAVALADPADFQLGSAHPLIKRASLCDSVKAATNGTFTCTTPAAYVGTPISYNWALLDPGFAMTPMPTSYSATWPIASTIGGGSSTPWVTSQPGQPICTTCILKSYVAHIGTTPLASGYSVAGAVITLKIKVSSYSTQTQYFTFSPPTAASYSLNITPTATGTVTSATITWKVNHLSIPAYQTTAPLTIVP